MANLPVINIKATGENIKRLRKNKGYLVREIQDKFGFANPTAIYRWEDGVCLPSVDNLVGLAMIFGVTIDDLLVKEIVNE